MVTAFQDDAFQKNAFQIDDTHDGGVGGGWIKKKRQKGIKNLVSAYKSISVEIPEFRALISAVDPFIQPKTTDEREKRRQARYIVERAPKAHRINFDAIYANELAYERLLSAIQAAKAQQEEGMVIVMLLMGF